MSFVVFYFGLHSIFFSTISFCFVLFFSSIRLLEYLKENQNAPRPSEHCFYEIAIYPTGGVLLYLPHHLDLASEDSVGHSTCMSVLARRRAIMGSIVQPKRSCLGLSRCCHVLVTVHAGASQGYVLGIPLYPTGRSSI